MGYTIHYLDVLARKPGALAGSRPLQQWRLSGRWTGAHDQLWLALQQRHGSQGGTRQMIELLQLGREHGYDRLRATIEQALRLGVSDAAAVRYLLIAPTLEQATAPLLLPEAGQRAEHYARPLPVISCYDELLSPVADSVVSEALP